MCGCVAQEAISLATSSINPLQHKCRTHPQLSSLLWMLHRQHCCWLCFHFLIWDFLIFDAGGPKFFEKYQPLSWALSRENQEVFEYFINKKRSPPQASDFFVCFPFKMSIYTAGISSFNASCHSCMGLGVEGGWGQGCARIALWICKWQVVV